jgi:hypothetical protein
MTTTNTTVNQQPGSRPASGRRLVKNLWSQHTLTRRTLGTAPIYSLNTQVEISVITVK